MQPTYPDELRLATLALASGSRPVPEGWTITDYGRVIGHGRRDFKEASARLTSWRAHESAGVRVLVDDRDPDLLRLRFGPTTSPCAVIERISESTRTVIVYATLPGHVECGEEAFIISLDPDGTVRGRCVAFSRHAWWLAKLGAPVARWVQKRITAAYVAGMRPVTREV